MVWSVKNQMANQTTADRLQMALQNYADQEGYSLVQDFEVTDINTSGDSITVCAEFETEADTTNFYNDLQNGGLANNIGPYINFGSSNVIVNGQFVCETSKLTVTVYKRYSMSVCYSFSIESSGCFPPNAYPHPRCVAGANGPYYLTYLDSTSWQGQTVYSFRINVRSVSGRCSNMELDKIEMLSFPDCGQSVSKYWTSLDESNKRDPAWDRFYNAAHGGDVASLKLNRLGLNTGNADGVEVYIALKAGAECPTIEKLCNDDDVSGTCEYAAFDEPGGCCISGYTNY